MAGQFKVSALLALVAIAGPVGARSTIDIDDNAGGGATIPGRPAIHFPPYLQCVPYARAASGITIFGDAHTWWGQAAGKYARGHEPRVGAVMAFTRHGNSRLGHVAAVSRIVDSRTLLISHANWSPINGRRGQIERNVRAIDVSPKNDWSQVRVWFAPIKALGGSTWPITGFIYNEKPGAVKAGAPKPDKAPLVVTRSAPAAGTLRLAPAKALTPKERAAKLAKSRDPIGDVIAGRIR